MECERDIDICDACVCICASVTGIPHHTTKTPTYMPNAHTHRERVAKTISIENQICKPYLNSHFDSYSRNMVETITRFGQSE